MDEKQKVFTYYISNLDKKCKVKVSAENQISMKSSTSYRFMIANLIKQKEIDGVILLVLRTIAEPLISEQEIRDLALIVKPNEAFWKLYYLEFKNLVMFLIDNIQISKVDALLMIELRFERLHFFSNYLEITTKLNEEIIDDGYA